MATDEREDQGGVPRTLLPVGYRSVSPMVVIGSVGGLVVVSALVVGSMMMHPTAMAGASETIRVMPTPIAMSQVIPDPTDPPTSVIQRPRRAAYHHIRHATRAVYVQPSRMYQAPQPVSYQPPPPSYPVQQAPVQPVVDEDALRLAAARYASSRMQLNTQDSSEVAVSASVAVANNNNVGTSSAMHLSSDSGNAHGSFMEARDGNPGYEQPSSPYELVTGTIIPVRLVTAIDSTIPGGLVKAEVIESVFDSRTHSVVVLPQGTIAIGYTDRTQNGEARLVAAWTEFYLPNGRKFFASSNEGAGLKGEAGMPVSVDTHAGRAFGASLVGAVLQAGMSQASHVSTSLNLSTGNMVQTQQVTPTMHAYPGQLFNIVLNHDLPLDRYVESE